MCCGCMLYAVLIAENEIWRAMCRNSLEVMAPFACLVVYTALKESSLEKLLISEEGRFDFTHNTMVLHVYT